VRRAPELVAAGLVVAALVALRLFAVTGDAAAPGGGVGHAFGVAGLLLMLVTEVAYSVRKRATDRAWGPLQVWLQVHVLTGIVGPALVLLHAPWRVGSLAGWATIATAVVAGSGFVGRFLSANLPRVSEDESAGGGGAGRTRAVRRAIAVRRALAIWHVVHVPLGIALFVLAFAHAGAALYFAAGTR
jgi:hypothetical protein